MSHISNITLKIWRQDGPSAPGRFETYQVGLPKACQDYARAVLESASMREWTAAALQERSFLAEDEPYRRARD